jgi:hypothetical protein
MLAARPAVCNVENPTFPAIQVMIIATFHSIQSVDDPVADAGRVIAGAPGCQSPGSGENLGRELSIRARPRVV